VSQNAGAGILFDNSTIKSGQVKPVGITPFNTDFTLQESQAVGNFSSAVALIEATATDVILKGDIIADNHSDGVFIAGTVNDLVIQDSHLGAIDVDGNPITTGDNFSREPQ